MAMEVGADLANMNETWWYPAASVPGEEYEGRPLARFVGVERTAPHSIMVDRFGQRFVNEAANYNDMQKAFFSFDANEYSTRHLPCWVVFDHQYRSRYPVVTARPGRPRPRVAGGRTTPSRVWPARWASTRSGWRRRRALEPVRRRGDGTATSAGATAPTTGSTETRVPPIPTWAPSRRARTTPSPSTSVRSAPRAGRGSTGTAGSSTCRDRPIPGLYGAGNVVASPAGPAYYGGGTSIGMGMVWGHLAGTHAALVRPPDGASPP